MKDIKKYMSVLLSLCLLLALAACGGGDTGDAAQPQTDGGTAAQTGEETPAEAAEAGQEQERVSVDFWAEGDAGSAGFYSEEPASATLTAQVPKDGTYLLEMYANGTYGYRPEPVTVSSSDQALALLNDWDSQEGTDMNGGSIMCLVDLTAGEYTLQAENACYVSADLTLVYPLESVVGPIQEGAYFCTLDEAMTVNYTLTGTDSYAEFYNGPADGMSQAGSLAAVDEEYTGEPETDQASVSFEPGMVVINFRVFDWNGSLEGAEAD